MNEIYQHTKGGVYQIVGRGTIEAPADHNYRDDGRCLVVQEDGKWVVKQWLRHDEEVVAIQSGNEHAATLQVSTGYEITDGAAVIIYRAADGRLWVRLEAEFMDGRFTKLGANGEPVVVDGTAAPAAQWLASAPGDVKL